MALVYLDTSYISACVSSRHDPSSIHRQSISREWWMTQAERHECFISLEVINELSHPNFRHSAEALELVQELPVLAVTQEVQGLAEMFVRQKVMPSPIAGDATHVAIATASGLDYLLTWNVRHLANPSKLLHLQRVCRRAGVVPPQIITPELLWEET